MERDRRRAAASDGRRGATPSKRARKQTISYIPFRLGSFKTIGRCNRFGKIG